MKALIKSTKALWRGRQVAVGHGELDHFWPGIVADIAGLWWFRGVWNPILAGISNARHLRHQGDTESRWWMPAPNEEVRDCFGRRGIVIVASVVTGRALVNYGSAEPNRIRVIDWHGCLSPLVWSEPGPQHNPALHDPAVFIGRDL